MQATDRCSKPTLMGAALAVAFTLLPTGGVQAQESPKDSYRAEIVILQRLVDPASIEEQMTGKQVEPVIETASSLWVEDASGRRISDLQLTNKNEMHLGSAARRLENSGNFRVLATAGWYQNFPQNYDGSPMRIAVGDWLSRAQQKAVEGYIEIDRKRYLHVSVHLNHWQEGPVQEVNLQTETTGTVSGISETTETSSIAEMATNTPPVMVMADPEPTPAELVTWIRETRRMRSEEIHFIDSPTIGVLVFFKKL